MIGCRYELDDLKHSCEALLETHIDEDSVCCLLSIAEQYNARKLKVRSAGRVIFGTYIVSLQT